MDDDVSCAGRPDRAALLAAMYAAGAALCLVGAAQPMSARTPVGLLQALGAVGVLGAALLWAGRRRLAPPGVHAALLLLTALTAVLAAASATAVGIVGLGPQLLALGAYAAHHLSARAARAHTVTAVGAVTAGAVLAVPGGFAAAWVPVVVAVLAVTEAQVRLCLRLRTAAETDPLTGLVNRRAWAAQAGREVARAARLGEPLTIALLDLDDFKLVNDRDGHGAGDALLRELAHRWTRRLRRTDLLGRHGGDEFALCLPGTDAAGAQQVLAQLRAGSPVRWSAGTAVATTGDTVDTLLARADIALYVVKRARRREDPAATTDQR